MADVMVLSSLIVATRTDAMPRISFSARLMSATSALSSSVIIIWAGLGMDVVVAIIVLLLILCAKIRNFLEYCSLSPHLFFNILRRKRARMFHLSSSPA